MSDWKPAETSQEARMRLKYVAAMREHIREDQRVLRAMEKDAYRAIRNPQEAS